MKHRAAVRPIPYGRLAILLQLIVAIAFLSYLMAGDHVRLPWVSDTYTLSAVLGDAGGLDGATHNAVLLAGVRVGEVRSVRVRDGQAVATLRMDGDSRGHVRAGSVARVVPRSALQDQTLEIQPGGGPVLKDGGQIRGAADVAPVSLDRVLGTLDADTRAQLQILLGELDTATKDRSTPLGRALVALADTTDVARRVATKLAERRRALTQLIGDVRTVFATLDRRDLLLRQSLRAGRGVLEVTARQDARLAATMRALPGTIDALGGALADVSALSTPLSPALDRLRPAARALPATLSQVRTTLPQLRGLVGDLKTLIADGVVPAEKLRSALVALEPASTGLTPAVTKLLPILKQADRNRDGFGLVGERFGGVLSTNDANGPILRGLGFFEDFDPADFGAPGAKGARAAALKLEVVKALMATCRTNAVACLARYLVPGLPGAIRTVTAPLGLAGQARRHALRLLASHPGRAQSLGVTPPPARRR